MTLWLKRALPVAAAAACLLPAASPDRPRTFANPINIEYRFMTDAPSRREAADPLIVLFNDDYYLFASKSGGYWHSKDMVDWTFVKPTGLNIEAYAPGVMAYQGALYYTACNIGLYKSTDPKGGKWELIGKPFDVGDPALFADDNGKVYLYYGLAYNGDIKVVELDPKDGFKQIGQPTSLFRADYAHHGFERRGEDYLGAASGARFQEGPWLEGSWMTKYKGTYYLQYAAPGTEFRTYADGYYTSSSPKGPFTFAQTSPFSQKTTGFITGAGHSATFADKQGRYWHISTMRISTKHDFERRLGIFPVYFDADGTMHADTLFGDFPMLAPPERTADSTALQTNWMVLTYGKTARASSNLDLLWPKNAFDEDIRTYWSARTANPGEWLSVDLGRVCEIQAIQVNFAEHEATALADATDLYHQYKLEMSADGKTWEMLVDKSNNKKDVPHDYIQLPAPVKARHLRITNVHTPGGAMFSIRDLRAFGSALGAAPSKAPQFTAVRDSTDGRNATVRWEALPDAQGYVVRYGVAANKLYHNLELRGQKEIVLHDLNMDTPYFFTVDAFNESGRTPGAPVALK